MDGWMEQEGRVRVWVWMWEEETWAARGFM